MSDNRPVPAIRIDDRIEGLRQHLGPATWVVLEDVALHARVDDRGRLVAATSSRAIALRIGRQASTVGDALRRLRTEGLLHLEQAAGGDGRFGLVSYVLVPPDGMAVLDPPGAKRHDRRRPVTVVPITDLPHTDDPVTADPVADEPCTVPPVTADDRSTLASSRRAAPGAEQRRERPGKPASDIEQAHDNADAERSRRPRRRLPSSMAQTLFELDAE